MKQSKIYFILVTKRMIFSEKCRCIKFDFKIILVQLKYLLQPYIMFESKGFDFTKEKN